MKKIYFLFLSLFLVGLSSCRDDLAKDLQYEDKGDKTETRSLSSNIFYWHNGERILLFPDNEKEYILYRASDENSLLQSVSKGVSNEKRGELPSYTTSLYVPSKQRPDIKGEKLNGLLFRKQPLCLGVLKFCIEVIFIPMKMVILLGFLTCFMSN